MIDFFLVKKKYYRNQMSLVLLRCVDWLSVHFYVGSYIIVYLVLFQVTGPSQGLKIRWGL